MFNSLALKKKLKKIPKKKGFFVVLLALVIIIGGVFYFNNLNKGPKSDIQIGEKTIKQVELRPNEIIIPEIGVKELVGESASDENLNKGPIYYKERNKPGEGNCVIAGHSAVTAEHSAPFSKVPELKIDQTIILTNKGKEAFVYKVTKIWEVKSTDLPVADPTPKPSVTLITCIPPDFPKDKRLIIRGELVQDID